MKIEINSRADALNLASKLRNCCATCASVTLPYGQSLEMVSSLFGLASWDTLSGVLSQARPAPSFPGPDRYEASMTMYWQLLAKNGTPSGWAKVAVSEAWLIAAASLFAGPAGPAMTVPAGAIGWNFDEDWNDFPLKVSRAELGVLETGELVLSVPSIVKGTVLTSVMLSREALHKLVGDAKAEGRTNLYHAMDMVELRSNLEEFGEMCFCDKCEADYPDGGDGYDGMCPSCADKAEAEEVQR